MLDELTQILLDGADEAAIPKHKVVLWMRSEDIQVLGAVFKLLHTRRCYSRIDPPLEFTDYHRFHLLYYEECIVHEPDGDWADSRYLAAHSLVNWFKGLWLDQSVDRECLRELKRVLEKLYRVGNEDIKTCVVVGVLEHLFEEKAIKRFFTDWAFADDLRAAYLEAECQD